MTRFFKRETLFVKQLEGGKFAPDTFWRNIARKFCCCAQILNGCHVENGIQICFPFSSLQALFESAIRSVWWIFRVACSYKGEISVGWRGSKVYWMLSDLKLWRVPVEPHNCYRFRAISAQAGEREIAISGISMQRYLQRVVSYKNPYLRLSWALWGRGSVANLRNAIKLWRSLCMKPKPPDMAPWRTS